MISILYVDDEPALLDVSKLYLEGTGEFTVDVVESAGEAMGILAHTSYDAIVSDYQMPEMDGIEFLKKVRSSGNTIPFILFTGRGREEIVIQAINEGADFYLQKGGEPRSQYAELSHKIKTAVERKRANSALKQNECRLNVLVTFYQMTSGPLKELMAFAVEQAVKITASSIGYLAFVSDDESILTMYAWSSRAMKECHIHKKPIEYPVISTGLWGEAVRQRSPVITNDYAAENPFKKGYPKGHVPIIRHMNIPVFDGSHIVMVAGVGNKTSNYSEQDVHELSILMSGLWNVIKQRRTEEASRINNERLRMAQEIGQIGSWELDLTTGTYWGSEEAFRIFAVPRPADGFFSIERVKTRIPEWERVHRALTDLVENGTAYDLEYALEPADNSPHKILHSVGKLICDAEKKPVRVAGVIHDITARKHAEMELSRKHDELNGAYNQLAGQEGALRQTLVDIVTSQMAMRESEEKYLSLFERSLDLIYIHDLEGNFIDANPAALALLGYARDDIPRLSFVSLISGDQIEKASEMIGIIVKNGAHADLVEFRLQKKNGDFVDIETKGSLILRQEKPYAILGIARDISERKHAENSFQMMGRKLQLLSGISRHDIQNQLIALRSAIDLIDRDHLDRESQKWIGTAEKAAETIKEQIEFTREYERLGIIKPRWQDVSKIFRHAALQFLMCDISLDVPAENYEIFADPLLEKVFYNLLDNALRHGGTVTCIALSFTESDGGLRIFVQDNGQGVQDEDKLLIFEQGFGRNTGLGLFLSKEILSITNITIEENGTPGEGARFVITVPKGSWRYFEDKI